MIFQFAAWSYCFFLTVHGSSGGSYFASPISNRELKHQHLVKVETAEDSGDNKLVLVLTDSKDELQIQGNTNASRDAPDNPKNINFNDDDNQEHTDDDDIAIDGSKQVACYSWNNEEECNTTKHCHWLEEAACTIKREAYIESHGDSNLVIVIKGSDEVHIYLNSDSSEDDQISKLDVATISEATCNSIQEKDKCHNIQDCIWIEQVCVKYPPRCSAFLNEQLCEKNDFLDNCLWREEKCIMIMDNQFTFPHPTVWPTYFPTINVSESPTTPQITVDAVLIIGVRTPDCPPLKPKANSSPTPRPIELDTEAPTPPPRLKPSTPPPTKKPTKKPTEKPAQDGNETNPTTPTNDHIKTKIPTQLPPNNESDGEVTFRRGDMRKYVERFGIRVSKGITVRLKAQASRKVTYQDKALSQLKFHSSPGSAAVIQLTKGGSVYVTSSGNEEGGVYGIYFDSNHDIREYKKLLSGTTRNVSGGKTPWNTYVTCENVSNGDCWQVDPDPLSEYHRNPEKTVLGGQGVYYEAVAFDDRNPSRPVVFLTEDKSSGTLRKYTPQSLAKGTVADWNVLHEKGGSFECLLFLDDKSFEWTDCEGGAVRQLQAENTYSIEGINVKDGMLYFTSKKKFVLYTLDLDSKRYTTSPTNDKLIGDGEFKHFPDELARNNDGQFLYFTEDGGDSPGVYALDPAGKMFAIMEASDSKYFGDATTGLAFSPDGRVMYVCFKECGCKVPDGPDCGCLFELTRDDGRSYDGESLSPK